MLEILTTLYFGMELYKWIIVAVVALMMVFGLLKKLTKLVLVLGALAAIYLVCSQYGILPF